MKVKDVMQPNPVIVAEDETLGLALQLMLWNEVQHLPVLRPADGRVTGMISDRDILAAEHTHSGENVLRRSVREFMRSPAEHIHPEADLADAAADLVTQQLGCLAVIDAGELRGTVVPTDVMTTIARCPTERPGGGGRAHTVASVMHAPALVAHPDDALTLAAARMIGAGARHLCVVDGEDRVLGILSDRDVRSTVGDPRRALRGTPARDLSGLTVGRVMTPRPRTLRQDEPIWTAIEILLLERFGALPIVDEQERLRGIVSYLDVLHHLATRTA
jgi:CBS domain-containing protein